MQPSILVTGASSGIGLDCARHFARLGWRVFAAMRSPAALDDSRITVLKLDVTDAGSIAQALEFVAGEVREQGLSALVNNAGIAVGGPVECVPTPEWRRQFETNVIGMIATTQAFLPLLRKHSAPSAIGNPQSTISRPTTIVNISSVSGLVSYPFMSPYAASKHAIEAMSDALRIELARWNIRVALIEPGPIATPIWDKSRLENETQVASWTQEQRELYLEQFQSLAAKVADAQNRAVGVNIVTRAIQHAVTSKRPRIRYPIGPGSLLARLTRFIPGRLWDWMVKRALGV